MLHIGHTHSAADINKFANANNNEQIANSLRPACNYNNKSNATSAAITSNCTMMIHSPPQSPMQQLFNEHTTHHAPTYTPLRSPALQQQPYNNNMHNEPHSQMATTTPTNNRSQQQQQSRCYLCETPKQDYALVRSFSEVVCRSCLNFEGSDRLEVALAEARQMKQARQTAPTSGRAEHPPTTIGRAVVVDCPSVGHKKHQPPDKSPPGDADVKAVSAATGNSKESPLQASTKQQFEINARCSKAAAISQRDSSPEPYMSRSAHHQQAQLHMQLQQNQIAADKSVAESVGESHGEPLRQPANTSNVSQCGTNKTVNRQASPTKYLPSDGSIRPTADNSLIDGLGQTTVQNPFEQAPMGAVAATAASMPQLLPYLFMNGSFLPNLRSNLAHNDQQAGLAQYAACMMNPNSYSRFLQMSAAAVAAAAMAPPTAPAPVATAAAGPATGGSAPLQFTMQPTIDHQLPVSQMDTNNYCGFSSSVPSRSNAAVQTGRPLTALDNGTDHIPRSICSNQSDADSARCQNGTCDAVMNTIHQSNINGQDLSSHKPCAAPCGYRGTAAVGPGELAPSQSSPKRSSADALTNTIPHHAPAPQQQQHQQPQHQITCSSADCVLSGRADGSDKVVASGRGADIEPALVLNASTAVARDSVKPSNGIVGNRYSTAVNTATPTPIPPPNKDSAGVSVRSKLRAKLLDNSHNNHNKTIARDDDVIEIVNNNKDAPEKLVAEERLSSRSSSCSADSDETRLYRRVATMNKQDIGNDNGTGGRANSASGIAQSIQPITPTATHRAQLAAELPVHAQPVHVTNTNGTSKDNNRRQRRSLLDEADALRDSVGDATRDVSHQHQLANGNGNNSSQQKSSSIRCVSCSECLDDKHFVQCPSNATHKFCFRCSKDSIESQRAENKRLNLIDRVFCPSGKKCFHLSEQSPWTFMNSEIDTIIRESKTNGKAIFPLTTPTAATSTATTTSSTPTPTTASAGATTATNLTTTASATADPKSSERSLSCQINNKQPLLANNGNHRMHRPQPCSGLDDLLKASEIDRVNSFKEHDILNVTYDNSIHSKRRSVNRSKLINDASQLASPNNRPKSMLQVDSNESAHNLSSTNRLDFGTVSTHSSTGNNISNSTNNKHGRASDAKQQHGSQSLPSSSPGSSSAYHSPAAPLSDRSGDDSLDGCLNGSQQPSMKRLAIDVFAGNETIEANGKSNKHPKTN